MCGGVGDDDNDADMLMMKKNIPTIMTVDDDGTDDFINDV